MRIAGAVIEQQKPLPLVYEEVKPECGYRMDLLNDDPRDSSQATNWIALHPPAGRSRIIS
jgi:hypothetical protein